MVGKKVGKKWTFILLLAVALCASVSATVFGATGFVSVQYEITEARALDFDSLKQVFLKAEHVSPDWTTISSLEDSTTYNILNNGDVAKIQASIDPDLPLPVGVTLFVKLEAPGAGAISIGEVELDPNGDPKDVVTNIGKVQGVGFEATFRLEASIEDANPVELDHVGVIFYLVDNGI